jgi:surface protein
MFESSLKGIFASIAISLLLLFSGCIGDTNSVINNDSSDTDTDKTKESTNKALKFTNTKTKSVDENQESAITLKAKNSNKDILTYSISGTDASSFNVDPSSGVVTFKIAPDYEAKSSYSFKATVSDGRENTTTEITININNIDDTKKGQLIDSAISGVEYRTNSGATGKTDDNGTFSYNNTDKTITFKASSLIIAKDFNLSNINSDNQILPSDIVGVDRNNTTDEKVVKLLRVLQSLDSDNNASNGILIDDNTKGYLSEAINIIDANISTLKTMVEKTQKKFINQKKSRMHYVSTLTSKGTKTKAMPFVTIWKTTSSDENITISINADYLSDYNYTVNWGDGNITKNINNNITHTYSSAGSHTVKISGKFPAISGNHPAKKTNSEKLQTITQWGDIAWISFDSAFRNCSNLDVNATDTPILSNVSSTSSMFRNAYSLKGNGYFKDWDLSHVANTSYMFYNAKAFNQPLNNWDVSKVTSMASMFNRATVFNQLINNWDVGKVRDMGSMFSDAKAFNQPLDNWNVGSATYMGNMFSYTKAFNQPLDNWNVGSVTSMVYMFVYAEAFNQPLNNWDVSSVTDMRSVFEGAVAFNQPLKNWNVSKVVNMGKMFKGASAITSQDLSSWNISNVAFGKHGSFMTGSGIRNIEPKWQK